jgi:hypothetical protein
VALAGPERDPIFVVFAGKLGHRENALNQQIKINSAT